MTRAGLCASAAAVFCVAALSTATGAASDAALKLRMQMAVPSGQTLTLDLQRWSTDEERAPFLSALAPPPAADGGGRGTGGRGGAASPGRGRGAALAGGGAQAAAGEPASADAPAAPGAAAGRGATGRGGAAGARGARGRGAGPSLSPEARLAAAVKAAPTLGFVWGMGVTGYSVKYAWRSSGIGRPERLVLITDRRLDIPSGAAAAATPATATSAAASSSDNTADFTVIEIRFEPKGTGAGKTSLTTGAVIDQTARTLAVQNYDAIPLQLRITP